MDSKICVTCRVLQDITEYTKDKNCKDGLKRMCRACVAISAAKHGRTEHARAKHRIYCKKFRRTEKYKAHKRRKKEEYLNKYKQSDMKVFLAIKRGILMKPSECTVCNKDNQIIHGHHEDYDKPLEVKWVCPQCHSDIHKNAV